MGSAAVGRSGVKGRVVASGQPFRSRDRMVGADARQSASLLGRQFYFEPDRARPDLIIEALLDPITALCPRKPRSPERGFRFAIVQAKAGATLVLSSTTGNTNAMPRVPFETVACQPTILELPGTCPVAPLAGALGGFGLSEVARVGGVAFREVLGNLGLGQMFPAFRLSQ